MTTILVIDDEPQIVRALRINLRARQYQVLAAGSAREAHTSSVSLRAKTQRLAKAGWLQTTGRPKASLVGSSSLQRLISS